MNNKCEVKYCNEKKAWRLYNSEGESVDGVCYDTKDEAVSAARSYCQETGDELSIYNKDGKLSTKRRLYNEIGE